MRNLFLLGILGMVSGCVAVPVDNGYPYDGYYGGGSSAYFIYNDDHEYNYRHYHYRDYDRRWDNRREYHRDNDRRGDGRWDGRDHH